MLKFPSFIYLQNQKTGSTFVEEFLREHCSEPLLSYQKHAALDSDPNCFCFTNIREPISLYRSLFAYGLDGRGGVYQRLCMNGFSSLYQKGPNGFADWLEFMVSSSKTSMFADHFSKQIAESIGLMTWRYLRLACPNFENDAPRLKGTEDYQKHYQKHNILNAVIRQEHLAEDLKNIINGPLRHVLRNHSNALDWISSSNSINSSVSSVAGIEVPDLLACQVRAKEELLYNLHYPEHL